MSYKVLVTLYPRKKVHRAGVQPPERRLLPPRVSPLPEST